MNFDQQYVIAMRYLESYKTAAKLLDRNGMNGRTDARQTDEIIDGIINLIDWRETFDVLDVGCGDGTLLSRLPKVRSRTGVEPTAEEIDALSQLYPDSSILFLRGTAASLPVESASADVIVCNSVFIILSRDEIKQALAEFKRVVKPGGLVYIGELPKRPPSAFDHVPRGLFQRAWRTLSSDGPSAFVKRAQVQLRYILSFVGARKIHHTPMSSTIPTDDFVDLCARHGFKLTWDGPYGPIRHNYLLRAT